MSAEYNDLAELAPEGRWRENHAREHFAMFYENESALLAGLEQYVTGGMAEGAAAIVIATRPHLDALEQRCLAAGIDLQASRDTGRYVSIDAEEMLSRLLLDGSPQPRRFADLIEPVVAEMVRSHPRVVAFGEMVGLLWLRRQYGAAIHLETMWNDLAKKHAFALFCAYPVTDDEGAPIEALHGACAEHERNIPAESYSALATPTERLAAICELQHKARRLETELVARKRLERQLAQRELELADFLENGAHPLHQVDAKGIIIWANKAELDLLGYAPAEYIGRQIADFHVDADNINCILTRLLAGETLHDAPALLRCKNGEVRNVLIHSNALWRDGKFVHTRCFTRDITGQVRAEEIVGAREEALKEADRRKDEFLALLAHELRNPLAPIRYALGISRKAWRTPEQRKRTEEIIERQVSHMSRLLDDLLDVSRITRGTLQLRKTPTELTKALGAAIEAARPLLDAKGHSLSIELPEEAGRLEADPVRLTQIFSNLLINAAKYTDAGGRIWLRAAREQDEFVVSVRDNGVGISAEMKPRLFTMFAQAEDAAKRSDGGLGIGLALVRGLVALHGGVVTAASEGVDRGSTFIVRLPAAAKHEALPEAVPDRAPDTAVPLRILVADDNRDNADACGTFLELCGHQVRTVYSGREAVALAETYRPEVAVLDIGMPEMNGYQVAEQLRAAAWGQSMTLIAVTGWGQDKDRARALEAGFDHHLTKPVDPAVLERLLSQTVRPDNLC